MFCMHALNLFIGLFRMTVSCYSLYCDIVQRRKIEFIPHEALQMLVGTTCGGPCVGCIDD